MDKAITVGELYAVLKMGVLRFYLCTESPIDVGDKDNELGDSNVNMDEQLNDVHERDEQIHTDRYFPRHIRGRNWPLCWRTHGEPIE